MREFQPSVAVKQISSEEYITQQRGDVLTSGALSVQTLQTVRISSLDLGSCIEPTTLSCLSAMTTISGVSEERRLSALAELWLKRALKAAASGGKNVEPEEGFIEWMEAIRYAYGYLFFTTREPGKRAFENRQTQVRDWYNYAVQQVMVRIFEMQKTQPVVAQGVNSLSRHLAGWTFDCSAHLPGAESEKLSCPGMVFKKQLRPFLK